MYKVWMVSVMSVLLMVSAGWAAEARERVAGAGSMPLDEMVVTATKMDRRAENLTDSVTVITEEEIEQKNFTDFTEILRYTPGVEFKQAGGPGQFNYPKLRGFGGGHFLTVIDGMKINEPLSGDVGHFLGQLDPHIVGRVEVLRGPQSALYGSNTTSGVFAVTTKEPLPGIHFSLGGEYGSLDWKKGFASARGSRDGFGYSFNAAYTDSEGVHDHETYENFTPHAKLTYATDVFSIEGSFFYMNATFNFAELNESYAADSPETPWWAFQTPDPNNENEYDHYLGTVNLRHQINRNLRHKAVVGWHRKDSTLLDKNDGLLGYEPAPVDNFTLDYVNYYNKGEIVPVFDDGSPEPANFRNENLMFDYNFIIDGPLENIVDNSLLLGYEYLTMKGEKWGKFGDASDEAYNHSFYINDQMLLLEEALVLSAGLRYDEHETYGGETTGKIGAAYTFRPWASTFFTNFGTSFRAPTFSNLYDPKYGNPDVRPEEGWTGEGGLRQDLFDRRVYAELVYWYSKLEDVIVYDSQYPRQPGVEGTGAYTNRDEAETEGVEFTIYWFITDPLTLSGNYTYTESWSEKDSERFRTVQIGRNKFNLDLTYAQDRYTLNLHTYYTDPRLRWKGDVEMDSYFRVDVSGRYRVRDGLALYGRVENLFDDKTEEALGFESPGIYAIAGMEWNFDL